ncbi:MAG: aspartate kinase [Euryarchaeota archaeon]|nr:aspartate kinase [Euryarchaeota archaeon]
MKFGGTSVGSGERISGVAELIRRFAAPETVVVTSAMSGVTDRLVEIAERVADGVSEDEIHEFIGYMRRKHTEAAREVAPREEVEELCAEVERLLGELEKILIGISYVGELTPRSLDYVLSFGERLAAPLLSAALRRQGIASRWYTGYEAGIVTDSNFGKASPLMDITQERVRQVIEPRLKDSIPVVTGFIAGNEQGRITTLGRGGSDYTAAILGAVLDADEIWIWTDVDGILTTDPRLVKEARVIEVLSYIEAMELAYFGAKVLHPKTIEPAMEKGIPVRVRNTFNPNCEGTLIVSEQEKSSDIVKAISVMKDVALLNISGVGMIGLPGVASRVFTALAQQKVNILMISQGSSEANISIVVERADVERAVDALQEEFLGANIVKDVQYNENVAIIAVVGAGMRGTKGVAARVFTAVASAGVNVLMIAQGSSEVNISFVVADEDAAKAARALHEEFITKGQQSHFPE